MLAPNSEKHRGPRSLRRTRPERRTHQRLRELCDEVLASYRVAIGDDLMTPEDREAAQHVLRAVVPQSAR